MEAIASTTVISEEDIDLQARRAALRRANAQTSEQNRIVAAKAAAEKAAAEDHAEERAAKREAEREAKKNEIMEAKQHKKDMQQEKNDCTSKPPGRRVLRGGLEYDLIRVGMGNAAAYGKKVSVRYEGRLERNGRLFDQGTLRFTLGKGEVIRGWDEGVKGMRVGEQRRLHVPAHLGYGKAGAPPKIPANADLVFIVTRN